MHDVDRQASCERKDFHLTRTDARSTLNAQVKAMRRKGIRVPPGMDVYPCHRHSERVVVYHVGTSLKRFKMRKGDYA